MVLRFVQILRRRNRRRFGDRRKLLQRRDRIGRRLFPRVTRGKVGGLLSGRGGRRRGSRSRGRGRGRGGRRRGGRGRNRCLRRRRLRSRCLRRTEKRRGRRDYDRGFDRCLNRLTCRFPHAFRHQLAEKFGAGCRLRGFDTIGCSRCRRLLGRSAHVDLPFVYR